MHSGKSTGKYWCFTVPPNLSNNSLEPVGVVVVTRISIFGYSAISLLKRGIEAFTSPTETACTQIKGLFFVGESLDIPSLSDHLKKYSLL